MIKPNKIVVMETMHIAICSMIMSLLLQSIVLIAGRWTLAVLLGNMWGIFVAVLNFFFMGISVQKAVEKDEAEAKKIMKVSQSIRTLMMFVLVVVGVVSPYFSYVAVIISLFFPRVVIALRCVKNRKNPEVAENNENK